jgi:hypothetical protein
MELCHTVNEQLNHILEGVSNKETIICGLMLPNSPLDVLEHDNEDDEHVIIKLNDVLDKGTFLGFRNKGTFLGAILDLARTYNDDTENISLFRYLELYHWGGFLAVPIEWIEKIKTLINKRWLQCLKKKQITTKLIASYERLLDDALVALCPLPLKYFNYLCKNAELYWQCCNINDCKRILDYNKINRTIQQHIWYTSKCDEYEWCDDELLSNRSCKLVFEKSVNVYSILIGKDGTRHLPDSVGGDLAIKYFKNKIGDGATRYLPDTVGGDLNFSAFNDKIGDGATRYLPDTVGGGLSMGRLFRHPFGCGVTRYLPDTVGGSLALGNINKNIGEGVSRYLPDTIGGSLNLNSFNKELGDGTTQYLPDNIDGCLGL